MKAIVISEELDFIGILLLIVHPLHVLGLIIGEDMIFELNPEGIMILAYEL